MAASNKLQALIILISLLGIVSASGYIVYNYTRYHILQIKEENIRLEVEKEAEALEKLPKFDKAYPEGIDYKKLLTKIALKRPKPTQAIKPISKETTPPPKPKAQKMPFSKLMKCWKCGKPFRGQLGIKRGKCPHCGAEWALK